MGLYPVRLNNLTNSISVLAITIGLVVGQSATQKSLAQNIGNGVGASTVNTLFTGIKTVAPSITLTYSPVGSGAGLTAFFTQTPPTGTPGPITFAASDDPVAGTETVTGGRGYVQVPVIGVGITLAYNASGLTVPAGGIKLSRASYCGILNGSITNWNDASISADNGRQIALNLPIKVVRRSDSSGSTFVVSSHLNTACKPAATPGIPAANVWNRGVGTTVSWPSTFIGATGGGGVASAIASTPGAIGYVDSATRLARNLPAALLRNKAGNYIAPSTDAITDALLGGTLVKYGTNPANRLIRIDNLNDPTRPNAYPISTATYLLFYDIYSDAAIINGIKTLSSLALGSAADTFVASLGYAPLPPSIKTVSTGVVNTCVNTVLGPSPCN
ncbi:ABC-type phosphate transport system periplasmic component-like protein [Nostoc commune NIES-4072]|uniref:Phosphate-binding protein n=1 Tax=Nostoc commune NIES-4072 TaxID=2005467 RepID=A0A2R5FNT5_NOSCO|nr:substrate-binding domain-containing protein [Nostoc commune]BBD68578.1 ABC-type phosphate transport system periplasmic component-like protein [Nostoc commune HK-02]GBG20430.1 ABC-type phosphate transport system periplasmic component-like protein [Nostoc commune NIES-4072]